MRRWIRINIKTSHFFHFATFYFYLFLCSSKIWKQLKLKWPNTYGQNRWNIAGGPLKKIWSQKPPQAWYVETVNGYKFIKILFSDVIILFMMVLFNSKSILIEKISKYHFLGLLTIFYMTHYSKCKNKYSEDKYSPRHTF